MYIYYRHGPYDGVIEIQSIVEDGDDIIIELPFSNNRHKYIWTPRNRNGYRIYQYFGICDLVEDLI